MKHIRYLIFTTCLLLLAACDKEEPDYIIGPTTPTSSTDATNANSPAAVAAWLGKYVTRLEVPRLKAGNHFVAHSSKEGKDSVMAYCLEYDATQGHSRWVAFRFDSKTRSKVTGRQDSFRDDPYLPADCHIGSGGFGGGYDRGHICASADRLYSASANDLTFFMSNMSPQRSRFNQDYWPIYEQQVQSWGRSAAFADTLYVVKGGTIGTGQVLQYLSRPNGKRVAVPKYYYIALLKVKSKTYSAIAFFMEHKDYGGTQGTAEELRQHAISIDELEERTGIDFFPNLPAAVETAVEKDYFFSNWGL